MSPSKPKTTAIQVHQAPPASFEEAVAELESLVHVMDSQKLGLDQLLTQYKRGAFLVTYCRQRLTQVREEVAEIEQTLNAHLPEGGQ